MLRLSFFVAATSLVACGGAPREGGKCDTNGFSCADAASALECKAGLWAKLPCRGAGGCKREADVVRCDMSANTEGDSCASTAAGRGLCTTDMMGTLECRDVMGNLQLVKTNTCRSCAVNGENIVCSP